jgi:hypothetical protein
LYERDIALLSASSNRETEGLGDIAGLSSQYPYNSPVSRWELDPPLAFVVLEVDSRSYMRYDDSISELQRKGGRIIFLIGKTLR